MRKLLSGESASAMYEKSLCQPARLRSQAAMSVRGEEKVDEEM